jgi:hypothetical protein
MGENATGQELHETRAGAPVLRAYVPPADSRAEDHWLTYKTLRWLMLALAGSLLVVTTVTAWITRDSPTSISAYYGEPVRDVFVGVLFAIAACLVAYRGRPPLEDFALNGAGFYAVFVALVPTNLTEILGDLRAGRVPGGATVEDYILYMKVTVALVLVACAVLFVTELTKARRMADLWGSGWGPTRVFVCVAGVLLLAFLLVVVRRLYFGSFDEIAAPVIEIGSFGLRIHDLAAILLIASLAVAVWTHAWPERCAAWSRGMQVIPSDRTFERWYKTIFALMTGGAVLVAILFAAVLRWQHTVIILEWWEILLFVGYWMLQTWREGNVNAPGAAPPPS